MTIDAADDTQAELLDEEAAADSAPVAAGSVYQALRKWRPGYCLGFIVNTINPVARITWPKARAAQEFLARIADGKLPPANPAKPAGKPRQQRAKRQR